MYGGAVCKYKNDYDPAAEDGTSREKLYLLENILKDERELSEKDSKWYNRPSAWFASYNKSAYPPTDGSNAHEQVRAKLCIQALSFESRNKFREICRGAVLKSEFSQMPGGEALDTKFDDQLVEIEKIAKTSGQGKFDKARERGVCALRSYIRKNHIYYMYSGYSNK